MSSSSKSVLFQATFFDSRLTVAPRSVILRAASFVEAAELADKLMASEKHSPNPPTGLLIEHAPPDLPPLVLREYNGVPFMVPKRVMQP
jgi:hypothetical protein